MQQFKKANLQCVCCTCTCRLISIVLWSVCCHSNNLALTTISRCPFSLCEYISRFFGANDRPHSLRLNKMQTNAEALVAKMSKTTQKISALAGSERFVYFYYCYFSVSILIDNSCLKTVQ